MTLLLVSLGVGLAGMLVFHLVMRAAAPQWPPPGTPPLPAGLWVATVVLLGASAALHVSVRAVRRDLRLRAGRAVAAALLLALVFLAAQAWNWSAAVAAHLPPRHSMYAITFYLLTGLHAAHALGGIAPLALVTRRARAGRYTAVSHEGLTLCAWFWHFVDAVWLVLFAVFQFERL